MFKEEFRGQSHDWNLESEKEKILKYLNEIRTSDDENLREAMVLVLLQMHQEGMMLLNVIERDMLEDDKIIPENVRRRAIKILGKAA